MGLISGYSGLKLAKNWFSGATSSQAINWCSGLLHTQKQESIYGISCVCLCVYHDAEWTDVQPKGAIVPPLPPLRSLD